MGVEVLLLLVPCYDVVALLLWLLVVGNRGTTGLTKKRKGGKQEESIRLGRRSNELKWFQPVCKTTLFSPLC